MITFISGTRAIGKSVWLVPAFRKHFRNTNIDVYDMDRCPPTVNARGHCFYRTFLDTVLDFWTTIYASKYRKDNKSLIIIGCILPEPFIKKMKDKDIGPWNLVHISLSEDEHIKRITSRTKNRKKIKQHIRNAKDLNAAVKASPLNIPCIDITNKSPTQVINEISNVISFE